MTTLSLSKEPVNTIYTSDCCKNIVTSSITLSVIISACDDLGNPNIGKSIHCWGFKRGFANAHISLCNSLISFYSKINDIEYACKVLEGLVSRDLVSWNSMINAFIVNERVSKAFGLLEEMELDGFKPDSITMVTMFIHGFVIRKELGLDLTVVNSMIDMYTKCYDIRSSRLLLGRMDERDLITWNTMIARYSDNDVVSWDTVIVGCAQKGFCKEALETFDQMLLIPINPDPITIVSVSSAFCVYVLKTGMEFNLYLINALLSMYCKCKNIKSAKLIFGSIPNQGNLCSWNSIISSYAQNKQPHKARELFYQMDFEPNEMTQVLSLFMEHFLNFK
ncbi:hypothetical protein AMTRI_Chr11g153180 [Amborella trichopoda]